MAGRLPKKWWTLAWLDREGNPCPHHRHENFTQVYKDERVLLEDLACHRG